MNEHQESIFDNVGEPPRKEMHGCVTAWLVLGIVLNAIVALVYFFIPDRISQSLPENPPNWIIYLLGVGAVLNVFCSAVLLKWKKIGFWGVIITSIAAMLLNFKIGLGIGQSVIGLAGVLVLFGILQIKKNNRSAWDGLE